MSHDLSKFPRHEEAYKVNDHWLDTPENAQGIDEILSDPNAEAPTRPQTITFVGKNAYYTADAGIDMRSDRGEYGSVYALKVGKYALFSLYAGASDYDTPEHHRGPEPQAGEYALLAINGFANGFAQIDPEWQEQTTAAWGGKTCRLVLARDADQMSAEGTTALQTQHAQEQEPRIELIDPSTREVIEPDLYRIHPGLSAMTVLGVQQIEQ